MVPFIASFNLILIRDGWAIEEKDLATLDLLVEVQIGGQKVLVIELDLLLGWHFVVEGALVLLLLLLLVCQEVSEHP